MSLLERIPNDGTFNQSRPLKWVLGSSKCYSFDLKSATEFKWWLLYYLFSIVQYWLDHNLAGSIVKTTLAHSRFDLSLRENHRPLVSFVAGQPIWT